MHVSKLLSKNTAYLFIPKCFWWKDVDSLNGELAAVDGAET
jgi:hypothetical protein